MADSDEIVYVNNRLPGDPEVGGAGFTLGGGVTYNYRDPSVEFAYQLQDISQSHHFTVKISKIKVEFPTAEFGNFLPVKGISYNQVSYDNMSIPVGIFGNFPVMHKKQVGSINLTLYDTSTDSIEAQIRQWESECFPKGKYVNFLSNIAAEFKYNSYTTTGKLNKSLIAYVIPAGSYSVSRSYEENNAKLINISLAVVGFKGNIEAASTPSQPSSGPRLFSGGLDATGNDNYFGGGVDAWV